MTSTSLRPFDGVGWEELEAQPIYLHFLDRELSTSVGTNLAIDHVADYMAVGLICTTSVVYCGTSLLWETPWISGVTLRSIPQLLRHGALETVSRHPTLSDFLKSRQELYHHDQSRYPMYFGTVAETPHQPRYKPTSTTRSLHVALSDSAQGYIESGHRPNEQVGNALHRGLARRGNRAITSALFASSLSRPETAPEARFGIAREISLAYTNHYIDFLQGDILTGIRGLSAYDALARNFPMRDYLLTRELISRQLPEFDAQAWFESHDLMDEFLDCRSSDHHARLLRGLNTVIYVLTAYLRDTQSPYADVSRHRFALLALVRREVPDRSPLKGVLSPEALLEAGASRFASVVEQLESRVHLSPWVQEARTMSHPPKTTLLMSVTRVEFLAMLEALGIDVSSIVPRDAGGATYFTLGVHGSCRVLAAFSEAGATGAGGGIATATRLLESLKPDSVISHGIAFAAKAKSPIGQVLVSTRVAEYEPARVSRDEVVPRGARHAASPRLLQRFRTAALPLPESAAKFGLLLSGDKLVDNAEFKAQLLAAEPEAIGGDMEGGAIAAVATTVGVEWIVAKAVCDYADGDKGRNKSARQAEAARASARLVAQVVRFL